MCGIIYGDFAPLIEIESTLKWELSPKKNGLERDRLARIRAR